MVTGYPSKQPAAMGPHRRAQRLAHVIEWFPAQSSISSDVLMRFGCHYYFS